MPKYRLNPRTCRMEQVVSPEEEIAKLVRPISNMQQEFLNIKQIRDGLMIGTINQNKYLLVRLNDSLRCCGLILNYGALIKHFSEPLVNFHRVWQRGLKL